MSLIKNAIKKKKNPSVCVCVCFIGQYLVGDVVDGDVVHGGGIALEQRVQIRSTVSAVHRRRK